MPTLIQSLSKDFNLSRDQLDFVKEKYKNKNHKGIEKIKNLKKFLKNY